MKMFHLRMPTLWAAAGLLLFGGYASSAPITPSDFVNHASVGNMFEMEEAKLAVARAQDPRLKDFAQRMLADHGAAEKKLGEAAERAGLHVESKLDAAHQMMVDNLASYNGADFDKIYTADQIAAHAETVNLLADYKQNGDNADVRSWASSSLPIVKEHQAAIDAL